VNQHTYFSIKGIKCQCSYLKAKEKALQTAELSLNAGYRTCVSLADFCRTSLTYSFVGHHLKKVLTSNRQAIIARSYSCQSFSLELGEKINLINGLDTAGFTGRLSNQSSTRRFCSLVPTGCLISTKCTQFILRTQCCASRLVYMSGMKKEIKTPGISWGLGCLCGDWAALYILNFLKDKSISMLPISAGIKNIIKPIIGR